MSNGLLGFIDDLDQAVIPNTFDFEFAKSQVVGVSLQIKNPRVETSRSACSHLGINFGSPFGTFASVKVAGKVQTFKRIDVTRGAPLTESADAPPTEAAPLSLNVTE